MSDVIVRDPLKEYEDTALMGCKAVREFLTYSGENKNYLNRAKLGAVAMGGYARLRATLANEKAIRLMGTRVGQDVPKLPEGV